MSKPLTLPTGYTASSQAERIYLGKLTTCYTGVLAQHAEHRIQGEQPGDNAGTARWQGHLGPDCGKQAGADQCDWQAIPDQGAWSGSQW